MTDQNQKDASRHLPEFPLENDPMLALEFHEQNHHLHFHSSANSLVLKTAKGAE